MNVSFYRPASAVLLRVSTGSPRRVCFDHSFSGRSNSKSNYRYEHTRQTQKHSGSGRQSWNNPTNKCGLTTTNKANPRQARRSRMFAGAMGNILKAVPTLADHSNPRQGRSGRQRNFTKPCVSKATITSRKNSTPASPPSGRRLTRLPKTQGNCISTISNSAHN
jgi:hypothetical protein